MCLESKNVNNFTTILHITLPIPFEPLTKKVQPVFHPLWKQKYVWWINHHLLPHLSFDTFFLNLPEEWKNLTEEYCRNTQLEYFINLPLSVPNNHDYIAPVPHFFVSKSGSSQFTSVILPIHKSISLPD